jgi:hypothetical protein
VCAISKRVLVVEASGQGRMLGLRCWNLLLQILLFVIHVNAKSATGDRILVIHEEDSIQSTFSQIFDSLKGLKVPETF